MKIRKITAFVLCLAMLSGTGCSLGKGSSSKTISGYSYSSSEKTKYDLSYFSFELSDDFSVTGEKESNDNGVYKYDFTGGGLNSLSVQTAGLEQCTAEISVQAMSEMIAENENDSAEDVETETLDVPGFNVAAIYMTNKNDDGDKGESYMYLSTEGMSVSVAAFFEPGDRDKIKALYRDIAATVKYTGTEHLPTEPQSYDCEYFSLSCGPEWYIRDTSKEDSAGVKLTYYYAQDMEHYGSPSLSINVSPEDEENDPVKRADSFYESKKESKHSSEAERGTGEIFGYKAETSSFVLDINSIKTRYKNYYFSENGCVYTFSVGLNIRDEEGSEAEIQAILDSVTIKKLSDEEVAARQQKIEAEKYQELTFLDSKFTLSSNFKLLSDYGSQVKYDDSKDNMGLVIVCDDGYNGDAEEYINEKGREIALLNDLDDLYYHKVIFKDEFYAMDYVDEFDSRYSDETRMHSLYVLDRGDAIWKFEIDYNKNDEEKARNYLESMLNSIAFE